MGKDDIYFAIRLLLGNRLTTVTLLLFVLAFGLSYSGYPVGAICLLGIAVGYCLGFSWGYLRGYYTDVDLKQDCKGDL